MKYVILLVCLIAIATTVTGLGSETRLMIWTNLKPYLPAVVIAAAVVLGLVLLANGGGYLSIF